MEREVQSTRNNSGAPGHRPHPGPERGLRWTRRSALILLVAALTGGFISVGRTGLITEETVARDHFNRGEVEEGRALLARTLQGHLDYCIKCFTPPDGWPEWVHKHVINNTPLGPDVSAEEWARSVDEERLKVLRQRASALNSVHSASGLWMSLEAEHRAATGDPIPDEVFDAVYNALTTVASYSEILSASRGWDKTAALSEVRKRYGDRDIDWAMRERSRALRYVLVFLRGSHLDDRRKDLFEAARRHRAVSDPEMELPETLEEFDALHPNVGEFFGYRPPKPAPRNRPTPTPKPPRVKLDPDDAISVFIRELIEKSFEGDLDYIMASCEPGVFAQDEGELLEIKEDANKYRLESIAGVYVTDLGNNELEVTTEQIKAIDRAGNPIVYGGTFILRKREDGTYKISYLHSQATRKREERERDGKK